MKQKNIKVNNVEVENNQITIEKVELNEFDIKKGINEICYGYRTKSGHCVRNNKVHNRCRDSS